MQLKLNIMFYVQFECVDISLMKHSVVSKSFRVIKCNLAGRIPSMYVLF